MGPVSAELEIDVPRERVFDFVADLSNRPSFTDHFISDFHLTRIEPTGVGAGARFRFFSPPQAVWMGTAVEEVSPPHRIVERGMGGRGNSVPSSTVWEFEAGPGTLTTARVIYWTEPPGVLQKARDALGGASLWHERNWRTALRRLRDQLESEQGKVERVGVAGGNRYATGIP